MDGPLDWAIELKRKPGSEDVAVQLLDGVLDALGTDRALADTVRHITARACRFVAEHSTRPYYALLVTLTTAHCTLTCSDHQDPMHTRLHPQPSFMAPPDETALLRELTAKGPGIAIPDLLIQKAPYVAVHVSCRTGSHAQPSRAVHAAASS
ncbi:hypothetical protein AB0H73_05230 [Streptomyces olivoreticuli]